MHNRFVAQLALGFALLGLSGCAALPNGRGWGQDATCSPGWRRIRAAVVESVRDPWVWAPLAGAAVFQFDGWDRKVSNWARSETPVFGSQHSAEQWSDGLRDTSVVLYHVSVLATPSGDTATEWALNKAKGYAVGATAVVTTHVVTGTLKSTVGRERPNGEDDASFPSGHTSTAAVYGRLASRNLRYIAMNDSMRSAFDAGLDALTIGTAWARVEAGWHYPSDTLAGMAIGHFFAAFFDDAFLGLGADPRTQFAFALTPGGGEIRWQLRF
jgi:membrane-associated phospholipid phosphatase